jgi:hypothetical protein
MFLTLNSFLKKIKFILFKKLDQIIFISYTEGRFSKYPIPVDESQNSVTGSDCAYFLIQNLKKT